MMIGFENPINVVIEHGLCPASLLESSWSDILYRQLSGIGKRRARAINVICVCLIVFGTNEVAYLGCSQERVE